MASSRILSCLCLLPFFFSNAISGPLAANTCPKTAPNNSGFETGSFKPWSKYPGAQITVAPFGYQSNHSALFKAQGSKTSSGDSVLVANVPNCANDTYSLSFAYYQRPLTTGKNGAQLMVRLADLEIEEYPIGYEIQFYQNPQPDSLGNAPGQWVFVNAGNFTWNGDALQFRIDFEAYDSSSAQVYVDDLVVTRLTGS